MQITEDYIVQRLAAREDPLDSDGYAEIELSAEIRLRNAAVLIPLVHFEDEWHLLFTRRTDRVESHKGQVSFPGGAADEGETSAEQTALREAEEEIGMKPSDQQLSSTAGRRRHPVALRLSSGEYRSGTRLHHAIIMAGRNVQLLGIPSAALRSFCHCLSSL